MRGTDVGTDVGRVYKLAGDPLMRILTQETDGSFVGLNTIRP